MRHLRWSWRILQDIVRRRKQGIQLVSEPFATRFRNAIGMRGHTQIRENVEVVRFFEVRPGRIGVWTSERASRLIVKASTESHPSTGRNQCGSFGSVARDDAGADSDVDILVELEPGRTLLDQAALQLDLEALLQCIVDVVTERGLRPSIRSRVLHESVPLRAEMLPTCRT